jgi:alpha-1,2-mannosyltransferase
VAAFALCSLLPFLYAPHSSERFWTFYVTDVSRVGSAAYVSNQSVRGVFDRLTHHVSNAPGLTLASAVIVVVSLVVAWRWWRRGAQFLSVLLVVNAAVLASPISWCHHLVSVVPALAWLWWGESEVRWPRGVAVAAAVLFWWAPMWRIANDGPVDLAEHGWALLASNAFALASAALLLAAAVNRGRETSSPGRPGPG